MKRTLILAVLMVLVMSSAVWAARSDLLSEPELNEIESIARAAYPRGTQLDMVVGDDLFGRYVALEFFSKKKGLNLGFKVYPTTSYVEMVTADSAEVGEGVGVKIISGIENILNKSPKQALGRNLLK